MMKKTKIVVLLTVMMIISLFFVSCLREAAEVSESSGVGREIITDVKPDEPNEPTTPQEPQEPQEQEPDENEDETGTVVTGELWKHENGKYTFNFPKRDKSGEKNLSDIASLYGTKLEDQPDDWYCGKTSYDESTGEATIVWDRYQSTIDIIEKYGAIYRGDTTKKVCYFTFDCGYEFGPTPKMLDTLKEKDVSGTFFLTGDYVESEYDLIKRMLDEGDVVGNHTVSHPHCNQLTGEEFIAELEGLEDMFYEQFPDAEPLYFFRPPYGNCNEYILALTQKMGYHCVMWSYTYMDYDTDNQLSNEDAMAKLKSGLHPGCVYLFHTESTTNAAILGDFIDWVRAQGYEILPIADIME